LLLLYGYWKIYNYPNVRAKLLEESLFQSGVRIERTLLESLTASLFVDADNRLNIDDVAKSHSIDGLISEKIRLAQGGFYSLTDQGLRKAQEMFADLVRRA